jgi:hypothetical protein
VRVLERVLELEPDWVLGPGLERGLDSVQGLEPERVRDWVLEPERVRVLERVLGLERVQDSVPETEWERCLYPEWSETRNRHSDQRYTPHRAELRR